MIWKRYISTNILAMLLSFVEGITGREDKALRREIAGQFHCISEGFYSDPNDCSIFYRCVDWGGGSENSLQTPYTAFKFQCGPATIFDTDTNVCVNPLDSSRTECLDTTLLYKAPEPEPDNSPVYLPPASSTEQPEFQGEIENSIGESSSPPRNPKSPTCSAEGFFPIQGDCTHFYRCVNSGSNKGYVKYEFSCATGTVWDSDNNACNHPWAVQRPDCRTTEANNPESENINNGEEQQNGIPQQEHQITSEKIPYPQESFSSSVPSSQAYSTSTASSTPSKNSTLCTTNTPTTSTSANSGFPKSCSSEGFSPVEGDCKKFIRCVNAGNGQLIKYDFECGEDTIWDTELNTCNYPYAVSRPGCGMATTTNSSQLEGQSSTSSQVTNNSSNSTIGTANGSTTSSSASGTSGSTSSTGSDSNSSSSDTSSSSSTDSTSHNNSNINSTSGNSYSTNNTTSSNFGSSSTSSTSTHSSNNQSASFSSSTTNSETTSSSSSTTSFNNVNASHQTTSSQQQAESSSTNQHVTTSTSSQENTAANGQVSSVGSESISTTAKTDSYVSLPATSYTESINSSMSIPTISSTLSSSESHLGTSILNETDPNQNASTTVQYTSTTVSTTQKSDTCTSEGFFPSTKNCNKFYRCVNIGGDKYIKYEFNCGPGTVWDPVNNACNHPWAVPDCKNGDNSNNTSTTDNVAINTQYTTTQTSSTIDGLTRSTTLSVTSNSDGSTLSSTSKSESSTTYKPETASQLSTIKDKNVTTATTINPDLTTDAVSSTNTSILSASSHEMQTTLSTDSGAQYTSTPYTTSTEKLTNTSISTLATASNTCITTSSTAITGQQTTTIYQTTMKPANQIECTKEGYFPYPGNCRKFYRCVDWDHNRQKFSVFYFDCPTGTIFDPSINVCNHEASVYPSRNCNETSDSTTSPQSTIISTPSNETTSEMGISTANYSTDQSSTTILSTAVPTDKSTTEHTTDDLTTITQTTQFTSTDSSSVTNPTYGGDQSTVTDHSAGQTTMIEVTTLSSPTTTYDTSSSPVTITTLETTTNNRDTSTSFTTNNTDYTNPETTPVVADTTSYSTSVTTTATPSLTTIASTTISASKPTVSPSTKCPEDLGADQVAIVCPTGFRRHPKHCNLFYQCTVSDTYEIKILTLSCTNGTVYDQRKIQCLPPDEAEPCDGTMADTRSLRTLANGSLPPIPVKSQTQICPGVGSHPYPDNCKMFYKCQRNDGGSIRGYIYQCPDGYTYWNVSKRCERMEKVPCDSAGNKRISRPTLAPVEVRNIGFK